MEEDAKSPPSVRSCENSAKQDDNKDGTTSIKARIVSFIGVFLVVLPISLIVVIIYLVTEKSEFQYNCYNFDNKNNVIPRNLENPSVFDDLTVDELEAVNAFMVNNRHLGITSWDMATINSSYIFMIDLFFPNKADVLKYLDNGNPKPKREAKVIVFRGDHDPPLVQEYIVSPLPVPKTVKHYKDPAFRRSPIPFDSRPTDKVEYKYIFPVIDRLTEELYPLLIESYELCYHNCSDGKNCMEFFDIAASGTKSGERKSWIWGFPKTEGYYIQPLGLEFLIDHKSTDTSEWFVEKIVYNGQIFNSTTALLSAYKSGNLKVVHLNINNEYSSYERTRTSGENHRQGPKLTEPAGKRFSINGRRILYNKWQFSLHMSPSVGLQIFDIRFDGTRIAYEISLQEAAVFYSGYGPTQRSTNFYDASWLIGASSMELIMGVDCPEIAIFLDSYFWANSGKFERLRNNICVFEENGGMPQRRHFANNFEGSYDFYGGLVDFHLVVRTIANIWNYDYLFDYIFYPNGAIEVRTSTTGYLQATFRLPKEEKYGSIINEHVVANVHHHLFNFKVDLDVAGDKNRYTTLDIELETVQNPWIETVHKTQMKVTHSLKNKETGIQTFHPSFPQYHLFHNKDAQNHYGEDRSYRLLNRAPSGFIIKDTAVAKAAQWARYPIAVTKRKDTERSSSSIYAQNDPWDPVLDFSDFLDGENIVDEDLVAWVTVGVHHIPGTEDVPSTPTTWNRHSFFLQPHNYFLECPTFSSPDVIVTRPGKEEDKSNLKTSGKTMHRV